MQSRLKELRLLFGLDPAAMAGLLDLSPAQWSSWEAGAVTPSEAELAAIASRLGLSPAWLGGADVPMWGAGLLTVRQWLGEQLQRLSGLQLMAVVSATTGERIAYVLRLLQQAAPELFNPQHIAAWLGLSGGSTELLLRGELDPGTPVVMRAADLTGVSEHWFRIGPGALSSDESE